jgi:predicted O-methyltransferase YrrM
MTAQLQAFNSDRIVSETVVKLIKDLEIECIVETGTFSGVTTAFLAESFPTLEIFTVEVKFETFLVAEKRLKPFKNVKQICGSSEKALKTLLPTLTGKRVLFYLDAHWEDYWPLLDELDEIQRNNANSCCIVIDDFMVPNRPFKYDKYKDQPLDLNYVLAKLKMIYKTPYYFFNDKTTRNPVAVGKLYCIPEEWKESLTIPLTKDAGFLYVK